MGLNQQIIQKGAWHDFMNLTAVECVQVFTYSSRFMWKCFMQLWRALKCSTQFQAVVNLHECVMHRIHLYSMLCMLKC